MKSIPSILEFLIILVLPSFIRCECPPQWFGQNCTQVNLCHYNNSSRCPTGFRCQTTDDYQECLAIATFHGNNSRIRAKFQVQTIIDHLSFKFRARPQSSHLFTITNRQNNHFISFYLAEQNLVYRNANSNKSFSIEMPNRTVDSWNDFSIHWSNQSTLMINRDHAYRINLTAQSIFLVNQMVEIYIGDGFRGCLDQFRLGSHLYVPFYEQILIENDTRSNRLIVEQLENIQINNCSFENVCYDVHCQHGQCQADFDRGICLCDLGWHGDQCELNIDECQLGHNCSKEHGTCQDHPDGYYTCHCTPGFTGK